MQQINIFVNFFFKDKFIILYRKMHTQFHTKIHNMFN